MDDDSSFSSLSTFIRRLCGIRLGRLRIHPPRPLVMPADEHGNLATSAYMGKPEKPVNVADREHFKVHRARDTQEVIVGKPVTGRVTGKAVVPITRRVNKPDGSFGGVAMVLIEHSRFTDVLHDAKLGQLDIISVIGMDGITRARLRGTTPTAGEDISKSPLFAEQAQKTLRSIQQTATK